MKVYIVSALILAGGCVPATEIKQPAPIPDGQIAVVPRIEPLPPLPPAIKYEEETPKAKKTTHTETALAPGGVKRTCVPCQGRTGISCNTCEGQGYLLRPTGLTSASGQWIYNRVSCTSCDGRGSFPCTACNSLGYTVERG